MTMMEKDLKHSENSIDRTICGPSQSRVTARQDSARPVAGAVAYINGISGPPGNPGERRIRDRDADQMQIR